MIFTRKIKRTIYDPISTAHIQIPLLLQYASNFRMKLICLLNLPFSVQMNNWKILCIRTRSLDSGTRLYKRQGLVCYN